LADKIPNIVTSLKKEGIPDEDIRKWILDKKINSVQKYGNKSHIGMILEFNDKSLLNNLILNEQRHLANETKKTQDFNKQVAKEAELKLLRQQSTTSSGTGDRRGLSTAAASTRLTKPRSGQRRTRNSSVRHPSTRLKT